MTSAQNLRQLSNGNKFLVFLLCTGLFFFSSCDILNQVFGTKPARQPERVEQRKKPGAGKEVNKPGKVLDTLDLIYPRTVKDTYRVAMMLPFFANPADRESSNRNQFISKVATDYYWGALLALDTLKSCGTDLIVHTYDTRDDSTQILIILNKMIDQNVDLIIGPLFNQIAEPVYRYSRLKRVNYVSPFYDVGDSGETNRYYFLSSPKPERYGDYAAEYLNKIDFGQKIFILREPQQNQKAIAEAFLQKLDTALASHVVSRSFISDDAAKNMTSSIFSDRNILFIPSSNEVFVASVFNQLRKFSEKQFTVIGLSQWLNFNTFDPKLWNRMNVHILTSYFINYSNPEVQDFVKKYRKKYNTEPSEYAFRGYDDMLFYGSRMLHDGKYFQRYFTAQGYPLLHGNFEMVEDSTNQGYYNQGIHLLKFQDFKLSEEKVVR